MLILRIFPTYLNEFTITKPANQIMSEIRSITDEKKIFRFKKSSKLFEGEIGGSWFKIKKIIHTRDHFLPEISGYLIGNNVETTVIIKARPDDSVIGFSIAYLGMLLAFTFGLAIMGEIISAIEIILFFGGFWYLLIMLGWFHGKKGIRILEDTIKR